MPSESLSAYLSWPSAPLTASLVRRALDRLSLRVILVPNDLLSQSRPLLQWATYDDIDHELVHHHRDNVLSSSYTFRKSLIRKHFLSRTINSYLVKNPNSILKSTFPRTFEMEISFADELDEMWTDELWELGNLLDSQTRWWILKPGMADRGMGIRLFRTKEELSGIMETFDSDDTDRSSGGEDHETSDTTVVTSQLRHFVIQEYVLNPLLLDPKELSDRNRDAGKLQRRKFHLRVYCLAKGDIQVFLYRRILALFSAKPYIHPKSSVDGSEFDLSPHLTNTSLQSDLGDENCSFGDEVVQFTEAHIEAIIQQMAVVLADTFKAALSNPVHFQPLPNAFELFGVDFLVSHDSKDTFRTQILELNSEPAIELTGPRLAWILEDLFDSIGKVCVEPFFIEDVHRDEEEEPWVVGGSRHHLLKCSDEKVRSR